MYLVCFDIIQKWYSHLNLNFSFVNSNNASCNSCEKQLNNWFLSFNEDSFDFITYCQRFLWKVAICLFVPPPLMFTGLYLNLPLSLSKLFHRLLKGGVQQRVGFFFVYIKPENLNLFVVLVFLCIINLFVGNFFSSNWCYLLVFG